MTPIDWIAVIFAIWVPIKFVIFYTNQYQKWVSPIITNSKNLTYIRTIELFLIFLFTYFILDEISISQFFVSILVGVMLTSHTLLYFPKVMNKYIEAFQTEKPCKRILLDWIIWLVLSAAVLYSIFF